MDERTEHLAQRQLRTPRAAAIAGILFALLFGTSWLLIRLALPAETLEPSAWLEQRAKDLSLAMSLIPFAGISFLWFMGVVRDRMGSQEDQFFSTLFFGSGYLYLGMTFASAAMTGGALVLYASDLAACRSEAGWAPTLGSFRQNRTEPAAWEPPLLGSPTAC
jgi:hypothetical protein